MGLKVLFAALAVVFVLTAVAFAVTLWNLRQLKARAEIRSILEDRLAALSLWDRVKDKPDELHQYLKTCYQHPDRVNLKQIPYDLFSMPTPYVGYAPEPGRQPEGVFNRYQMRDPRPVDLPKPRRRVRIFLTGGSFAYGTGLPGYESLISTHLERALEARKVWGDRTVEVFTAAAPAWCSTHERIWIENRLTELEPDLVISLSGANEALWGFQGRNVLMMRAYEDQLYFEVLNRALRLADIRRFPEHPPYVREQAVAPAEVARRFRKNMHLASNALAMDRTPFIVALQPTLTPKFKPVSEGERQCITQHEAEKLAYVDRCGAAIADTMANNTGELPTNLFFLDLRDTFSDRPDNLFLDLFHTGDKGSALMGRRLAEAIQTLVMADRWPGPQG